ncbi:MAG: DNA polymerase III subunit delta [Saprospiraceae bacterium]
MRFSNLIGQQAVATQLRSMYQHGRMPHALLLLGPEGSGKLALAIALAQYLLCDNRKDTDACGQCAHCQKMQHLVHPDLHFVFPVVGSKMTSDTYLAQWRAALEDHFYRNANDWLQYIGAENKQGNITKEECLAIVKKLSLKTFESQSKIMLIWLPEYLGKEGNRLLKIIEEPPENTFFILVAQNAEQILNTILSRCQLIKVNALSDAEVIAGLEQKYPDIAAEKIASIAYRSAGNFNEAIKLAEAKENDHVALFLDWLRKAYVGNGVELVAWSEAFAKLGRENQKQFFQYALHFLREFLQLKLVPEKPSRLGAKELKTGKNLVKVLSVEQVEQMVQLFTDAAYYIERNGHPKIIMLDVSIQLAKIMKRPKQKVQA